MQLTQQKTLKNLIHLHIHTCAPFGLLLLSNQCTKDAKLPDLSRLCSTWDGGCLVAK